MAFRGRRGIGVPNQLREQQVSAKLAEKGEALNQLQLAHGNERLTLFKKNLQDFAQKHGDKIRSDPTFRYHFNQMCTQIGVDPLASGKGFWAATLGIGDFYYELAQQAAVICLSTRALNGGLMPLRELHLRLRRKRPPAQRDQIGVDDVACAVAKLACLGGGYRVVDIGGTRWVQSQAREVSTDGMQLVALVQDKVSDAPQPPPGQLQPACVTDAEARDGLRWAQERVRIVIDELLREGIVWVDVPPDGGPRSYWFPGLLELDL